MMRETVLLCPCEGITEAAVQAAIDETGARSCDEARKLTRAGMGNCQGRMCVHHLQRLLAESGAVPSGLRPRPPLRPIALGRLGAHAASLEYPRGTVGARVIWGVADAEATLGLEDGGDRGRAG